MAAKSPPFVARFDGVLDRFMLHMPILMRRAGTHQHYGLIDAQRRQDRRVLLLGDMEGYQFRLGLRFVGGYAHSP